MSLWRLELINPNNSRQIEEHNKIVDVFWKQNKKQKKLAKKKSSFPLT